jgi:transcriptional regulator with XRE-family HTH domain
MMTTESSDVNLKVSIGMVVKAWRERSGLTVTQLAERTGRPITKGYISELERGKIRQPGDDHLVLLSRALEIPVLYLVSRRLPDRGSGTVTTAGTPTFSRRRGVVLASPLRAEPPPESGSVEAITLGQRIDAALEEEGLSIEEQERIATILIPHTKELAQLVKLARGGSDEAE